jgi:hypothetical protein
MTQLTPKLDELGDVLEQAAAADLAGSTASTHPRTPRLTPRRRMILAASALAIILPGGGAIAAALFSSDDVSRSIVAGGFIFQGTHPDCTVVTEGVEYHCMLDKPPIPEVSDFKGTVYQTVDATQHVNGGCRSLASAGLEWECYVGEAAVEQKIISEGFLGEIQTVPAVG